MQEAVPFEGAETVGAEKEVIVAAAASGGESDTPEAEAATVAAAAAVELAEFVVVASHSLHL